MKRAVPFNRAIRCCGPVNGVVRLARSGRYPINPYLLRDASKTHPFSEHLRRFHQTVSVSNLGQKRHRLTEAKMGLSPLRRIACLTRKTGERCTPTGGVMPWQKLFFAPKSAERHDRIGYNGGRCPK